MGPALRSITTPDFRDCFQRLPQRVQRLARKNYALWQVDPHHPSLQFKCVIPADRVYSVRVGLGWRALAAVDDDIVKWFWIGSHSEYDRILRSS